jgi:nucleoside-diphosphate-sugar epimerase
MPVALITGITGYLGSHLAEAMLGNGWTVAGLKRKSSWLGRIENIIDEIDLYDVDSDNLESIFRQCKPDIVVHLAATYGRRGEKPFDVFLTNVAFSMEVFKASDACGVELFVNCDTSLNWDVNAYAMSKSHFRGWLKLLSAEVSTRIVNLRTEHFYGPGDDPAKFTAFVVESCCQNRPELNLTEGLQERDFIYIDDLVAAIMLIVSKSVSHDAEYVEFNIGSGKAVTVKSFVELVKQLTKAKTELNFGSIPYRKNEPMICVADISALMKLGWSPSVSLEDGLRNTISFYRYSELSHLEK